MAMKISYILPDPSSYTSWNEFSEDVAHMKDVGYDAIELQIADPDDLDEGRLKNLLDEVGYDLVAVQTGTTYYTRGNCLSSPDAQVRRRTIELLRRFVDFARRFSSILVFGSLQGRIGDEPDHAAGTSRIIEAIRMVGEYASKQDVVLAYEPVNHLETAYCNRIADVEALVRRLDLAGVKMMIDTFHMNIEERTMTQGLDRIKDVLRHVHLSETNRDVLGQGHWDCEAFFKTLDQIGYDGYCSIGVYNTRESRRECMKQCWAAVRPLVRHGA